MHMCVDGWMGERTGSSADGWRDGCEIESCMQVIMDGWMCGWKDGWMNRRKNSPSTPQ